MESSFILRFPTTAAYCLRTVLPELYCLLSAPRSKERNLGDFALCRHKNGVAGGRHHRCTGGGSVARMTVEPGAISQAHRTQICLEGVRLLARRVHQQLDYHWVTLNAGDTLLIPAGAVHHTRNQGDEPSVLMIACSSGAKTKTGRLWVYVRDERSHDGDTPPAAACFYRPDRTADHPQRHLTGFTGHLVADAYAGVNALYTNERQPGPVIPVACRTPCQAQVQ
ncbi:MAG: transposase [Nitratireductor sp.]